MAAEQRGATLETEGGLHARVSGHPRRAELPYSTRVVVQAAAAGDVLLRTGLASVLTVPGLAWAARGRGRGEARRLALYRELAQAGDADATFPAPPDGVCITARRPPGFAFRPPDGRVELLRFDSPYEALHPELRASYASFRENRVAWAQHWRHHDGPRPTLVVVHGFGASPYWLNSAFFALPSLYRKGYDVLLYVLPFHGARQPRMMPLSGWGLFAHGAAHLNEAILHGIHDLRVFLAHLRAGGGEVGVTGLSLGGYTAALLAAVDDRLAVAIPNAPVVEMGGLLRSWFPASGAVAAGRRLAGLSPEELDGALAVHSPLTYAPRIPRDRRMVIGGLGDRLAPPAQSRLLWEHWDRCRLHWFPGNHVVHFSRGVYLREMLRFMRAAGFAPATT